MIPRLRICAGAVAVGFVALAAARNGARAQALPTPRLYVLDCGTLGGRNLRTYGLPAEPRDMSVACALVVDGARTLLWETGLGDRFADGKETPRDPGWRVDRAGARTLGAHRRIAVAQPKQTASVDRLLPK
jgi:hypothetical protein